MVKRVHQVEVTCTNISQTRMLRFEHLPRLKDCTVKILTTRKSGKILQAGPTIVAKWVRLYGRGF